MLDSSYNTPGFLINFKDKDGTVEIEKLQYKTDPIIEKWHIERDFENDINFESSDINTSKSELTRNELKKLCVDLKINTLSNNTRTEFIDKLKNYVDQVNG